MTECHVAEDERTHESKGFGIVEFETKESAASARKIMHRAKFNDREVYIKLQ